MTMSKMAAGIDNTQIHTSSTIIWMMTVVTPNGKSDDINIINHHIHSVHTHTDTDREWHLVTLTVGTQADMVVPYFDEKQTHIVYFRRAENWGRTCTVSVYIMYNIPVRSQRFVILNLTYSYCWLLTTNLPIFSTICWQSFTSIKI